MHAVQALQRLPDGAFTVNMVTRPELEWPPLIESVAEAVRLPPMLCVKWLRADCCTRLDLSKPGESWTPELWRGVAGCMHAVSNLQQLHVSLPMANTGSCGQSKSSFSGRGADLFLGCVILTH